VKNLRGRVEKLEADLQAGPASWQQAAADQREIDEWLLGCLANLAGEGPRLQQAPPDAWLRYLASQPPVSEEEVIEKLRRACPEPPGGWVKR
jgi:hypothetical protein